MGDGMFDGLGAALRQLRERRGLQQKDVAERASVNRTMMSRYESGAIQPQFQTLERILRAMDVEMEEFFEALREGSTGEPPQNTFVFILGSPDPAEQPLVDTLQLVEGALRRAREDQERRQRTTEDRTPDDSPPGK